MAVVVFAPNTTGKALFEGTQAFRNKDDAGDNFVAGVYSHVNIEFSATEAGEWVSFFEYLSEVVRTGGGALNSINNTGSTIKAGPVRVTGVSGLDTNSNPIFTIAPADANNGKPATAFALADITNSSTATLYLGGTFASGISLQGTIGITPIYLAPGGGVTQTEPTGANQITQIVGYIQTNGANGSVSGLLRPPLKISQSFLRVGMLDNSVIQTGGTNANVGNASLYAFNTLL